ncbi:MAG: FAD-dependent oxidoreductase [Gemmatimonadales bacterium]|nr:FAD-dependent oxidoreductase [Gemmatimonadales bacterium]
MKTPEGERTIEGSHILRATDRVPNTDRLNLEDAGVGMDAKGFVVVGPQLETSAPGVYALGDVKGIRINLLQWGRACITDRLLPYAVFIDPNWDGSGSTRRKRDGWGAPTGWPECLWRGGARAGAGRARRIQQGAAGPRSRPDSGRLRAGNRGRRARPCGSP